MALIRLDIPGFILYGGSIQPGRFHGRDVTIVDVFEGIGANAAGRMSDADLRELEHSACPGAGACGGQFTANTMATAIEILGLAPVGMASVPATDPRKDEIGFRAGQLVMDQLERGLRPSDILTRGSFENAIASACATGGSTNIVLHSLAMAREAGIPLTIDDINPISERTPVIADLMPGGRFTAVDVFKAGGIQLITRRLIEGGKIDGSQLGDSECRPATQADRRPGRTEGQSRAGGLRHQDRRCRSVVPAGTCAPVRPGRRRDGRRDVWTDQSRRCHRDPLRGPAGRTRHA
jgi:dihydroxy-acid dehydratase